MPLFPTVGSVSVTMAGEIVMDELQNIGHWQRALVIAVQTRPWSRHQALPSAPCLRKDESYVYLNVATVPACKIASVRTRRHPPCNHSASIVVLPIKEG